MDEYTYLLYSHDSYKDILDIHLKQYCKFINNNNIVIGFNNNNYINENYGNKYNVIEYDDSLPYMSRIFFLLENISTKYVIFMHDINIPIDSPKLNILNNTISFMNRLNVDQVRFFAAGISEPIFNNDIFHKIPDNSYFFSINPAIWNRISLLDICFKFKNHVYTCSECSEIQEYVRYKANYYISSENDIKLEGCNHVISYYFPFCHVTTHGKWRIHPFNKESLYIYELLSLYEVDINTRGIN